MVVIAMVVLIAMVMMMVMVTVMIMMMLAMAMVIMMLLMMMIYLGGESRASAELRDVKGLDQANDRIPNEDVQMLLRTTPCSKEDPAHASMKILT